MITLVLLFNSNCVYATDITTTDVINATVPGLQLPSSEIDCMASGSLLDLVSMGIRFMSQGNAFFVSTADKKMAIFQQAQNANGDVSVNVFIKADNIQRNTISALLSNMVVVTMGAQSIFYIMSMGSNYLYDGATQDSTVTVLFRNVGNIMDNGMTYVAVNGDVNIFYPRPPTYLSGTMINLVGGGAVTCMYSRLPLDDQNLQGIEQAFDGGLVNDIINGSNANALRYSP